jgi:uncharacterized SAM-binding protein YcdF (DUF218 family)
MPRRLARRTLVLGALVLGCGSLIAALPMLLVVSDPLPASADAIFVFAGDVPERPRCAAELYRRGLAPVMVFSGGVVRPELAAAGRPLSEAELDALVARGAGVPAEAEVVISAGTSTWEDAIVLRDWMAAAGARRVVAVTSALHARRARRTLRIVLGPAGGDVTLVACGPRLGIASAWWLEERALVAVANEALKLALYGVRYFAPHALGLRSVPARPGEVPWQVP